MKDEYKVEVKNINTNKTSYYPDFNFAVYKNGERLYSFHWWSFPEYYYDDGESEIVYLMFKRDFTLYEYPRQYLPLLKYVTDANIGRKSRIKNLRIPKTESKSEKKVIDILGDMDCKWFQLCGYSSSRVLAISHFRKAEMYVKGIMGTILIIKKQGGYLAYSVSNNIIGNWNNQLHRIWKAYEIDLQDALELIKKYKDDVKDYYYDKGIEETIKSDIVIDKL